MLLTILHTKEFCNVGMTLKINFPIDQMVASVISDEIIMPLGK